MVSWSAPRAGETGAPPAEQQKATDELGKILAQRLTDKFYPQAVGPDGKPINNVPIEDKQNLVSDNVEKKYGNGNKPEVPSLPQAPDVPQPARDMSDRMNRTGGAAAAKASIGEQSTIRLSNARCSASSQ